MVLAWTNASPLLAYTDKQLVGMDGWMVLVWFVEKESIITISYDIHPLDHHINRKSNNIKSVAFVSLNKIHLPW